MTIRNINELMNAVEWVFSTQYNEVSNSLKNRSKGT